jgi:hypothetical protein
MVLSPFHEFHSLSAFCQAREDEGERIDEYGRGFLEGDTVLALIRARLGVVPFERERTALRNAVTNS